MKRLVLNSKLRKFSVTSVYKLSCSYTAIEGSFSGICIYLYSFMINTQTIGFFIMEFCLICYLNAKRNAGLGNINPCKYKSILSLIMEVSRVFAFNINGN